jgi:CRP-like cAMP-binding protein
MSESGGRSLTAEIVEAAIADSEFLKDLEEDSRTALLERATEIEIEEGETLTTEGEAGDAFFILQKGKIRVTVLKDDEPTEMAVLGPGAVLGEISMLTDRPRTATCQVVDGVAAVIRVGRDDLDAVLADRPEVEARLNAIAFERARATMRRLYS